MSEVQLIPPEEMHGESDWEDQDLLTIEDAQDRIRHELELCRVALDGAGLGDADGTALRARAEVLKKCLDTLALGATPLAAISRG